MARVLKMGLWCFSDDLGEGHFSGGLHKPFQWYQEKILSPRIRPCAGTVAPGFLLGHISAQTHVTHDKGTEGGNWPSCSPDLHYVLLPSRCLHLSTV